MASEHPMDQMRVRAIRTLRREDEDEPAGTGVGRRWHVPGHASAVFSCSPERAKKLKKAGNVIVLRGDVDDGEVPTDETIEPDGLPLDFVYRSELVGQGFTTLSSLRELLDLTEIKGIGDAKASAIQDALDELE